MEIVKAGFVVTPFDAQSMLQRIELAGRTCYRSEARITPDSSTDFVKMILKRGHESVLEHECISARFTVDRGVSHELVRHRIGAFSQESARYCDYGKGIRVIEPPFGTQAQRNAWLGAMHCCENAYFALRADGVLPEIARSVLPTCLATEIVATFNLRQWRHVFRLRTAMTAHPQMQSVMTPLLTELRERLPVIFDDMVTLRDLRQDVQRPL